MRQRVATNQRDQRERMGGPALEAAGAWWARGDAPVRVAEAVAPLVDGRAAMLAMCATFLTARESIWLAGWDMHANLLMVRGPDLRAGRDGTPAQLALIQRLRAAGLDEEAIRLWRAGGLRVKDVLGFAARRGVDVHVLLWGPFNPLGLFHMTNNAAAQRRILEARGVHCRLDKNSRSPLHMAQALHQKCAVVDGAVAFVGGVDLTIEYDGDFDRWDVPAHAFTSSLRVSALGRSAHPWHDAHIALVGEPARDVERNIQQRWDESGHARRDRYRQVTPPLRRLAKIFLTGGVGGATRAIRAEEAGKLPQGAGPELPGGAARVQIIRTIPALTYRFAPAGIHGIVQAYTVALRQARRFIYLESQYLWLEGFNGIDTLRLGWQSHYMEPLFAEIAAAAARGVTVAILLPDHPNAGRAYTDGGVAWLRRRALGAAAEGRLRFFTLATSLREPDGSIHYRPIYVHAKVGIVDDRWATAGSANLNSRGMSHDAELNVAVLDGDFARGLRQSLWAEHLGLRDHAHAGWPAPAALPVPASLEVAQTCAPLRLALAVEALEALEAMPPGGASTSGAAHTEMEAAAQALRDPAAGIQYLARRADENLERLKRGEPLQGQLLPYLTSADGERHELAVSRELGYLDPLRAARYGVIAPHPGKYT